MSKKKSKSSSAPQPPAFTPSAIYIGGRMVGQTYLDNGVVKTQYFESPEEIERRRISEQRVNQILPTLGQTAPEIGARYDQMRDDYIAQQTGMFDNEYNKTMKNLREDIGARFGTLKATPYFDKLEDLQKNVRNPAMLEIQRSGSMYRKDLDDQEQARKLNELSALGYSLNSQQQNFLSGLSAPQSLSGLFNQFNQNTYSQRLAQFNNDITRRQNATTGLLGSIARFF